MIKIGLLGLGNIGKGVVDLLDKNKTLIKDRTGKTIEIKTVLEKNTARKALLPKNATITTDIDDILNDPEIKIVIEVLGGENPAYDFICKALKAKKYVVTANKEVIAKHKETFFKLAYENNVDIFFEASVAAGLPLIRSLKIGLAANKILELYGILNGTTNYILTKIEQEKREFKDVLKEAQKLGLAEADPTMDIAGTDAAYKLIILAATAFKTNIQLENLHYEGIEKISLKDILYADELGYRIKLLAIGKRLEDDRLILNVAPTLIPKDHPLASIQNEFNAVFTNGNAVGETMITGKGAGPLPTASSLVSDVIDICFGLDKNHAPRNIEKTAQNLQLVPFENTTSQFFIRLLAPDQPGVLEKISGTLSENSISISKLIQKDKIKEKAEIVIITHEAIEKNISKTLKKIKNIGSVISVIRVGL